MNGDSQNYSPDPNQVEGHWQYVPGGVRSAPAPIAQLQQQAVATPAAPVVSATVQPATPPPAPDATAVEWTASEFVSHGKNAGWYMLLGLAILVVAVLAYLLTRDFISTTIVVLIACLVAVSSSRRPRTLPYRLDAQGLTIGSKLYSYAQFKSFSVMSEGAFSSIMFLPMQRLMPTLSVYYDPADEDRIVTALSAYLPMEERRHDVMDSLARRLRF